MNLYFPIFCEDKQKSTLTYVMARCRSVLVSNYTQSKMNLRFRYGTENAESKTHDRSVTPTCLQSKCRQATLRYSSNFHLTQKAVVTRTTWICCLGFWGYHRPRKFSQKVVIPVMNFEYRDICTVNNKSLNCIVIYIDGSKMEKRRGQQATKWLQLDFVPY